jgi:arylsulfatase A-like enzyme
MKVQWKGTLTGGQTYDQPVISLDILPTALAAAGVSLPADSKVEGVNWLPFLTGMNQGAPHAYLCWRMGGDLAIRDSQWKLRVAVPVAANNHYGYPPSAGGTFLVDLAKDPAEKTDLSAQFPEKVKELKAAWDKWNAGNIPGNFPAAKPVKDKET